MSKDYYKILNVDKNSSPDEIKKSYRKLSKEFHPDLNKDQGAEDKFKEINEAYEVLGDEAKKKNYDKFGSADGNPFPGGGFNVNDIFSMFNGFGGQKSRIRKGTDSNIKVNISLNDIINGVDRKIKYTRQAICNSCNGKGGSDVVSCSGCNGTGQRRVVQNTPFGTIQQATICNLCSGTGESVKSPCNTCKGSGTEAKEEIVDIQIPKGAVDGIIFTMPQQGNYVRNGAPGDLRIYIEEIEDNLFKRDESDLMYDQEISIIDAILGKDVELETPHGKIRYKIAPGSEHDKVLKIAGKGIPDINYQNVMGNLLIFLKIKIPKNISNDEKDILNKLKEHKNFK